MARRSSWGALCLAMIVIHTTPTRAQSFYLQGDRGSPGPSGDPEQLDCSSDSCNLSVRLEVVEMVSVEGHCGFSGGLMAASADFASIDLDELRIDQSVWLPECPRGYSRMIEDGVPEHVILCERGRDQMVKVGDIWVDRFEASVWANEDCVGGPEAPFDEATPYGLTADWPPWFPYHGQFSVPLFACSVSGVIPSAHLTWFQAQATCAASGKHLISNAEWQGASIGSRDPGASDGADGACVTSGGITRVSSEGTSCVSYWGAEDMIGNLWERTSDWYGQGLDSADGTLPAEYFGDGYWNVDAALHQGEYGTHFPAGGLRGGAYDNATQAGVFALYLRGAPSLAAEDTGFRCARGF